jgi:hypothetical protein
MLLSRRYCPAQASREVTLGRLTRREVAPFVAAAMAVTLAVGSCGSGGPSEHEREANVYAAVIRALALDEPADPGAETEELDWVVYAGSLDEERVISLEVQAAVVEMLEDFATIRFVDEKAEAIDDTADGEPVLDDGVLVLLGAVPTGRSPSVDAERYVDLDDDEHFRIGLERTNDNWSIVDVDAVGT